MEKKISLVISAGETKGKVFLLQEGTNTIGRWDPDHGAFPEVDLENHDEEAKVSRKHAIVEISGGTVTLQDAGSMNGTFVNRGKRLLPNEKVALNPGDEIIIGKTFLKLKLD